MVTYGKAASLALGPVDVLVDHMVCPLPEKLFALGHQLNLAPDRFGFFDETHVNGDVGEMRHRINNDGYLYVPRFWAREVVQSVRESLTRQLDQLGFLVPGTPPDDVRFNGREVGRAMGNPLDQKNPLLRELVFGERISLFFQELLGGVIRHFDFIWFRTKGPGFGSPLHCDIVYMGRGTHDLYTAWVPLGDVSLELGGLLMLEESHKQSDRLRAYLNRDVDEYCENRVDSDDYASGKKWWDGTLSRNPVALQEALGGRWLTAREFKMGDILIFNMTMVHGSLDNQTDRIRLSTDTRYQLASEPVDDRWVGESPPGHAISQRRGRVC